MSRRFWDQRAALFRQRPSPTLSISAHDEAYKQYKDRLQRRAVFDLLRLSPSMDVLDLGCGVGRWSFLLAPHVRQVWGTDVSADMIRIARSVQRERQVRNITFCRAASEDLPFRPAAFDAVLSVTVMQHIPDHSLPSAIGQVARVLRPGGQALLLESTHEYARSDYLYPRPLSRWRSLFAQHDMDLVASRSVSVMPLDALFGAARALAPASRPVRGGRKAVPAGGFKRALKRVVLSASLPLDMCLSGVLPETGNQQAMLFRRR